MPGRDIASRILQCLLRTPPPVAPPVREAPPPGDPVGDRCAARPRTGVPPPPPDRRGAPVSVVDRRPAQREVRGLARAMAPSGASSVAPSPGDPPRAQVGGRARVALAARHRVVRPVVATPRVPSGAGSIATTVPLAASTVTIVTRVRTATSDTGAGLVRPPVADRARVRVRGARVPRARRAPRGPWHPITPSEPRDQDDPWPRARAAIRVPARVAHRVS